MGLVAIAGIVYPFKPFGKRRNAFFTLLACLAITIYSLENHETTSTRSSGKPIAASEQAKTPSSKKANKIERGKLEETVRKSVEVLLWTEARTDYRQLTTSDLATDEFKNEIEARMLELVRPLPASEHEANLKGYQLLGAVRPDNPEYTSKIKMYEEAIKSARQSVVAVLREKEDRVEGITWYRHPNAPKHTNSRSTAFLYIGKKGDTGRPWLRMRVQYAASDWLFVNKVTAWHDGVKEPLVSGRFETDHHSSIWEWIDVTPDNYQIEVLQSLANAKEAILRFEGSKYYRDKTLSAGDKKAIREVLLAYDVMRSDG